MTFFLKTGDTRLCLFAAGNDPEIIERDRMGTQKRKQRMEGKGGEGWDLGHWASERRRGPQALHCNRKE